MALSFLEHVAYDSIRICPVCDHSLGGVQISRSVEVVGFVSRNSAEYSVFAISFSVASQFMSEFEVLGNVGLGVWHWGLYYRNELLSVVTFGTPCFGGKRGQLACIANNNGARIIQLCRGGTVPTARTGVPSKSISMANRAMREKLGPYLAVAYADEALGEIGTIYQAAGAIYTGVTNPKGQANYLIHGKIRTAWQVRRLYGTRDRRKLLMIDPNLEVHALLPKHRYVFVSAPKRMKRRLINAMESMSEPFPQRGC